MQATVSDQVFAALADPTRREGQEVQYSLVPESLDAAAAWIAAIGARPGYAERVQRIYHIATAQAWALAQTAGSYRESTRGLSLADVGFIHCSYTHQVARVAEAFYTGMSDLVLLAIEPERLTAELREERVDATSEAYPHIYGPLNLDAVIEVTAFETPG